MGWGVHVGEGERSSNIRTLREKWEKEECVVVSKKGVAVATSHP